MHMLHRTHLITIAHGGPCVDDPWHDFLVVDFGEEGQGRGHQPVRPVPRLHQAQPRVRVRVDGPQTDSDGRPPKVPVQLGHEVLDSAAEGAVSAERLEGAAGGDRPPPRGGLHVALGLQLQDEVSLLHPDHRKLLFTLVAAVVLLVLVDELHHLVDDRRRLRDIGDVVVLGCVEARVDAREEASHEVEERHHLLLHHVPLPFSSIYLLLNL